MKSIKRKSSARWSCKGSGSPQTLVNETSLLKHVRCLIRVPLPDKVATNAAELVAAAHAGSFSIALARQLRSVSSKTGNIVTTATVTLEEWTAGWTVTHIHLNVLARLPNVTQCEFIDATVRAKTNCLVSRLVRTTTSMNAKLEMAGRVRPRPKKKFVLPEE